MADRWLITARKFKLHASLEAAEAERDRLALASPGKTFHVVRCKTHRRSDGLYDRAMAALRRLANEDAEAAAIIAAHDKREGRDDTRGMAA